MIKDVDNSKVISDGAIESPVLGIIPPTLLSVAGELVLKVHIKYQYLPESQLGTILHFYVSLTHSLQ